MSIVFDDRIYSSCACALVSADGFCRHNSGRRRRSFNSASARCLFEREWMGGVEMAGTTVMRNFEGRWAANIMVAAMVF